MTLTRTTAVWTTRGAIGLGAVALLAACGSSPAASDSGPGSVGYGGPEGQNSQGAFGGGQGFRPGASGKIEAITGSTAQVQNTQLNQQVAVTWNASTTFSQEVATSRSEVKVGSCVVVTAPSTTASASTAPSTAAPTMPTAITAASVRITQATDGTCTAGGGRPGTGDGQRPAGQPGGQFTGAPGGQNPGEGNGQRRGGFRSFGAFGKVTAVSASGFTVQSDFGGQATSATVTTTGSTTYMTNGTATSAAVEMGACMQAQGTADSTGAVTATHIAISQPVDGSCTGGFGPRG